MKRIKSIILYSIILIIFYFLLSNILFQIDETPRWAAIKHPEQVAAEIPFDVIVKYNDIDIASRLVLTIVFTDKNGGYCSARLLGDYFPVIYGNGETCFNVIITTSDIKGKDISNIRIIAERHEYSGDINKSIYECKIIGKSIDSEVIPIVKANADGTLPGKNTISLNLIIDKAINEGCWIKYAGDFTFAGWFITAIYFFVFLLCFLYLKKLTKVSGQYEKPYIRFWIFLTVCIFLLGVNKQLDIQILIRDIARTYSKANGWYVTRKYYLIEFIAIFVTIGLGVFFIICNALKNIWRSVFIPITGLCILFSFIIIKASSFHVLENYFDKTIAGFNLFGIIELAGLLCIGLSAIIADRTFNTKYSK